MLRVTQPVLERAQVAFGRPPGLRITRAARGASTVCMAHPRRVAKVAKQIEREVGNLLITDKVVQAAVCPERRRGFDGALSALASVTEVHISNDLQVAKVYMSIYSDDVGKAAAMEGLQRLEGYVRKHIGKQIRLRLTPEIRFVRDDSIERSERIYKLLDQVKKIERGEAEPPPLAFYGDVPEEEEEWDEDEDDFPTGIEMVDLGMFGHDEPASKSSSRPGAAAGGQQGGSGSKQQRRQEQQQQQQASNQQRQGEAEGDGGKEEDDGDFEEMLAAFKAQVEARQQQRGR